MILVTGGAGVMGARLVRGLVQKGNKVRVLTLPHDPKVRLLDGVKCEIRYGDVSRADSLRGLFDGVDTVYHLAAIIIATSLNVLWRINVEGTRHVVEGARTAGAGHVIYVSSASVEWPQGSDYAQSKLAAEQIVKSQAGMRWTIIRPTLTYGRNEGQEFLMFLESLTRYPVVAFIGRGRAMKSPVLVDDVVHGLLAVAGNPKTYGKTYNFSGGEVISIRDLARLMLKHRGIRKPLLAVPVPVCRALAWFMERTMKCPPLTRYSISRILHDAALDNSSAHLDLDYNPVGVREGLRRIFPPDGGK